MNTAKLLTFTVLAYLILWINWFTSDNFVGLCYEISTTTSISESVMEVRPKCNIRSVQLFTARNLSEHFEKCGVCFSDDIITILRKWQAEVVSCMEAIYEKVL